MRLDHALCLALICLAPACTPTEPEPPGCEVSADSWQPGQLAFRDASSDWGIEAPDVLGVRVAVTDIDSDGWPDLVTRRGGGPDVFSSDPELASRSRWRIS